MKNRLSWQKIGIAELTRPSVATLLIANVLPLFGVLFLGWKIFPLLVLFWLENVVVGVFNVFKMLVASPTSPGQWVAKLGMIPFFCFHYGMFTLVHGIFVFVLFGGVLMDSPNFPTPVVVAQVFGDFQIGWHDAIHDVNHKNNGIGFSHGLGNLIFHTPVNLGGHPQFQTAGVNQRE